jgi:uncharacterized membrane protein YesL
MIFDVRSHFVLVFASCICGGYVVGYHFGWVCAMLFYRVCFVSNFKGPIPCLILFDVVRSYCIMLLASSSFCVSFNVFSHFEVGSVLLSDISVFILHIRGRS